MLLGRRVELGVGDQGRPAGGAAGGVHPDQHLGADRLEVGQAGDLAGEEVALRPGEEEDVERNPAQGREADPEVPVVGPHRLPEAVPRLPVADHRLDLAGRRGRALGPAVGDVARLAQAALALGDEEERLLLPGQLAAPADLLGP